MSNKIDELKLVLKGGSKATKYKVSLSFPAEVTHELELSELNVLCKATSFPSISIGQIEVFNQGRKLPIPGDTAYDNTWAVTFYVDNAHKVRKDFLYWMKCVDNFQANTHSGDPAGLFVQMSVSQLDSLEKVVAEYTFKNVWPQQVGEISIGADQLDTIQEFDVTFSYSDWIIASSDGSEYNMPHDGRSASTNVIAPDSTD